MWLKIFLLITSAQFTYSSTILPIIWNNKHYEMEKISIPIKSENILYFLDILGKCWHLETQITSNNFSVQNILNVPTNTLSMGEELIINHKIIEQYNKIIFYHHLKKLYMEAIINLEIMLEELKMIGNITHIYGLQVAMDAKKRQLEDTLKDIDHNLNILYHEYDDKLLLEPKPQDYFIIPMKHFNIQKISFYIKNSFDIINSKYKFNNLYHNPINGFASYLVYEDKLWTMKMTYSNNMTESLQYALELEEVLVNLQNLWLKKYYTIMSIYQIIQINKMQLKNIQNHIHIIEQRIHTLKKTDPIKHLSKLYKLQQQLLDLKTSALRIQLEQVNNIWIIFINIIPVNYCKKVLKKQVI